MGELDYSLREIWPGGYQIKTNKNTYEVITELNREIKLISPQQFTILPDFSGYFVKSRKTNPLVVDWITELYQGSDKEKPVFNEALLQRFYKSLDKNRGKIVLLIPKFHSASLWRGFFSLPENSYYSFLKYIPELFTKYKESKYFTFYR